MSTPIAGPTQHTRVAAQQVVAKVQTVATVGTSDKNHSEISLSSDPQSGSTIDETIISDDLASPVVPR